MPVPKFGNRRAGKRIREQLQGIVHDYIEAHEADEVDLGEVAEWAIQTGRYSAEPISIIRQCKEQLSEACRSEVYKDPQGRDVRRMHPVRIVDGPQQMVFWADITTAKPGHMRLSFQQRRTAILADCKAHKTDVEFYNDNNSFKVALPLFSYNFDPDIRELQLPNQYPDEKPN